MRPFLSFAALALVVAACTQGGGTATTTAETSTTSTTAASTTTAPSTTTTTEATTTTVSAADQAKAAAAAFAGSYEGEWRNLTFGSSGPIVTTVTAGTDGLEITTDLGGFVFGESDPDPETFTLAYDALAAGSATGESAVFGPFTMTVGPDGFTFEASGVPSDRIASMTVDAQVGDGTVTGTYEIAFEGGGGASGEFDLARTS